MIRIVVTSRPWSRGAVARLRPLRAEVTGERLIWLEASAVNKLAPMHGPGKKFLTGFPNEKGPPTKMTTTKAKALITKKRKQAAEKVRCVRLEP
jgi:hypothetical protein